MKINLVTITAAAFLLLAAGAYPDAGKIKIGTCESPSPVIVLPSDGSGFGFMYRLTSTRILCDLNSMPPAEIYLLFIHKYLPPPEGV